MNSRDPIIILEDDVDEHELLTDAFHNINVSNPLKFFTDGESFLEYLNNTADNPLIIISAINLHKMDGLQVRAQIQAEDHLRSKGIPYIFYTVKDDEKIISKAYDLTVQGYFIKGSSINAIEKDLKLIIDYWKKSRHPNQP